MSNRTGKFLGTPGCRGEFFMKLVSLRITPKGVMTHYLVDKNGNMGVFRSSTQLVGLRECFDFKATVKRNEIDSSTDERVTVFKRIRLLKNYGSVQNPRV